MKPTRPIHYTALSVSGRALATASLFVASTAVAQSDTPGAVADGSTLQVPDPASTPNDSQTTDQAQSDAGEIIVTAQKREQRLQDVPVTVTLVDSKQLDDQNITSIADLTRAVPALQSPQSIRGVATGGFTRSSEQAVSTVLDGVVMGNTSISNLFDIDRVEVLSGPQGMLFGKNASAGVINIVTNRPKLNTFEAIGSVDWGSYDYERERVTVNLPVGSTAAVRFLAYHSRDEGLVENTVAGRRNYSEAIGGRARLRWQAADNLEINLIGDYERGRGSGGFPYTIAIIPNPTTTNAPLVADLEECGITASETNRFNCSTSNPDTSDNKRYGISGQIDYTLPGNYVLTSITARRWAKSGVKFGDFSQAGDSDMVQRNILDWNLAPSNFKVFTQELRVTSPTNQPLEFVAGLYYYNEQKRVDVFQAGQLGFDALFPLTLPPPFPPIVLYPDNTIFARYQPIDVSSKSYSAFGQLTYHVTDQFSLIAGARLTHEKLRDTAFNATLAELAPILEEQGFFVPTAPNPFLGAGDPIYNAALGFANGFITVDETVKEDNFSWRLGAQYDFSRNLMAFATVARGYKGPAVNDQGVADDPIIEAEIPLNIEVGTKATVLDGRLFTAVTLFHTKVKDFQTQVFAPGNDLIPAGFVQGNAPWMRTYGIDVSFLGRPFEGFTVSGGAVYTRAKFSSNFRVPCGPQQTPGDGDCETVNGSNVTPPNSQVPNVPKFRLVMNGEYAREFSTNVTGFVQSDIQYQTKTFTGSTPDPILRLPDTFFLNGRVGVRSSEGRWSASVWGRNLLGKRYNVYSPDFVSFAPGRAGTYLTLPSTNWKTTYGVSLDVKF